MLKVHARNLGNVTFLCLQGQIVNSDAETLRNAVQYLSEVQSDAQSDVNTIVLDFAQVSTIDAGGLGVMLELRTLLQSKGIAFKLMNVSKLISRVLEISRLDTVFEVTSGVEFFPAVSGRGAASVLELASCA